MFLTVEGIEGAGKSTFLGLLENELAKRGVNFLRTREPGGCALGQQIRHALHPLVDIRIPEDMGLVGHSLVPVVFERLYSACFIASFNR